MGAGSKTDHEITLFFFCLMGFTHSCMLSLITTELCRSAEHKMGGHTWQAKQSGMGVIARDHTGQVVLSPWDFIGSCTWVEEAEVRACLAGLYVGISLNKPIIVESDSSFVVSFLANDFLDRSSFVDLKREGKQKYPIRNVIYSSTTGPCRGRTCVS